MRFYLIFIVIFSIHISSEIYEKIHISEKKKDLSNEIFKKLSREHYVRNFDDQDFNKKYFEAIFQRLDKEKNYFIRSEVDYYLKEASQIKSNKFDIELAYELINLYYEKLVAYSEFQINLIENTDFDFTADEYLDIFEDDNEWQINISGIEEIWRLETKNDLLVAKLSDSSSDNPKEDISKRYKNRLRRIAQQKEEDIFSLAMNILTNQF